jgi:hypothetical protein
MADKRIKDLATTAAASASDDFFAIDGTTNATRKLSAYTPTFSTVTTTGAATLDSVVTDEITGDPVVSGNLTVSGTTGATAIDYILGTSGPSVKSSIAARAIAPGIYSTGTTDPTISGVAAFGVADYTVAGNVMWIDSGTTYASIVSSDTDGFELLVIQATGQLKAAKVGVGFISAGSTTNLAAGVPTHVAITRSGIAGNNVTYYINGVACGIAADNSDYLAGIKYLMAGANGRLKGMVGDLIVENRALSAAEVKSLYESGPSEADYNSASSTAIVAGSFVVGKKYRITSAGSTDFTLIGAADSDVGTEFTATGVGTGTGEAIPLGLVLAPDYSVGAGLTVPPRNGTSGTITLPASGVTWSQPNGGMWCGAEISDPAAPPTNYGVMYFRDNGAGKTQLVARFPTGAVQVIATEP